MLPWFFYLPFAYSRQMEFILGMIVAITVAIYVYVITSCLLDAYEVRVPKMKIVIAVALVVLYQTLLIYVPYALNGFTDLGSMYYFITTPNPTISLLIYFISIYLFKMSRNQTMNLTLSLYLFSLLGISLSRVINFSIFAQTETLYNYMKDAGSALTGAVLNVLIYFLGVRPLIKRFTIYKIADTINKKSFFKQMLLVYALECMAYFAVVFAQILQPLDSLSMIYVSIVIALSIALNLIITSQRADRLALQNKSAHITTLNHAISEFHAVKHDFYNILNTYSGYLSLDDLQGLSDYHKRLMDTTIAAGDQLDFSKKMDQNPALCALLLQKTERARKMGSELEVNMHCPISNIAIDNFDLCRMLANLLDNAIEAASELQCGHVNFSIEQKSNEDILIVITNTVPEDVVLVKILNRGYTTKKDHDGQGLSQVRAIISKYTNCNVQFTCYNKQFSTFIEICSKPAKD